MSILSDMETSFLFFSSNLCIQLFSILSAASYLSVATICTPSSDDSFSNAEMTSLAFSTTSASRSLTTISSRSIILMAHHLSRPSLTCGAIIACTSDMHLSRDSEYVMVFGTFFES